MCGNNRLDFIPRRLPHSGPEKHDKWEKGKELRKSIRGSAEAEKPRVSTSKASFMGVPLGWRGDRTGGRQLVL